MKVNAIQTDGCVICQLSDGRIVEVTVLSIEGEEVSFTNDVQSALGVLQHCLPWLPRC